jgi:ArsR family transcriptional regulator
MRILADAGLVRAQRIGKFTYYKRNDAELRKLGRALAHL